MSAKVAPDGLNRGTPLRSVLGFGELAPCMGQEIHIME
jgi:hypothetical protein